MTKYIEVKLTEWQLYALEGLVLDAIEGETYDTEEVSETVAYLKRLKTTLAKAKS